MIRLLLKNWQDGRPDLEWTGRYLCQRSFFCFSSRACFHCFYCQNILPSYAGFQLEEEVKNLSHAFKNPKHPFLFILGGAKFSTKMPLIKKYLKLADYVFIGGALANDFLKAKGYDVGKSLVDDTNYGIAEILKNNPPSHKATDEQGKLILPTDFVIKNKAIIDIGKESVKNLETLIKKSKLILWNGPLGKYEDGGAEATKKILKQSLCRQK